MVFSRNQPKACANKISANTGAAICRTFWSSGDCLFCDQQRLCDITQMPNELPI